MFGKLLHLMHKIQAREAQISVPGNHVHSIIYARHHDI